MNREKIMYEIYVKPYFFKPTLAIVKHFGAKKDATSFHKDTKFESASEGKKL